MSINREAYEIDSNSFSFLEDNNIEKKKNGNENIEIDQEIKLEALKIKETDIEGIKKQMEIEMKKDGTSGKQSWAFEYSALMRLIRESPEIGIKKVELSGGEIKKCQERMEEDIVGAIKAKTESVQKEWEKEKRKVGRIQTDEDTSDEKIQLAERIKEEINSEQVWIREFQVSYLKEIVGETKYREKKEGEKSLELSDKEWKDMVSDIRFLLSKKKKDWRKIIPRIGHMNNLEPDKFGDVSRSLFDRSDKDAMLKQVEKMGGDGKESDAWKFGSELRYVTECFPDLRSRIKLDNRSWKKLNNLLEKARKEGDFWKVSYQECNMKIIENMVNRGEIKAVKGITLETKLDVE